MLRDLRFALRSARRAPALACTVVLTLALGLGISTTVFSLVDAILLRPLPVERPDQLVLATPVLPDGTPDDGFPIPEVEYLRDRSRSLAGVIAFDGTRLNAVVSGNPRLVTAMLISADAFDILGVRVMGRTIRRQDDRPGASPVAVVSCQYAASQFGASAPAIGQTLTLTGLSATVVGVLPCDFPGLSAGETPADVWLPMALHPQLALNDHVTVGVIARLAPGADAGMAESELTDLHRTYARNALVGRIVVRDGSQGLRNLSEAVETPLRVLTAAAIAVLLLVCANVMNLLLTRGTGRRQELAIRLAMGASRPQLVRQLVTETLAYATVGGALGVLLAGWAGPVLVRHLAVGPGSPTLMIDVFPRGRVIAFAAVAVLATVLAAGIGPALRATQLEGHTTGNRATIRLGQSLATVQVCLSLVLLIVTSQLLHGVATMARMDPGFERRQTLQFRVYANTLGYGGPAEIAFYERIRTRLDALPGVRAASVSRYPAATGYRSICHAPIGGAPTDLSLNGIGARYWTATGTPLLRGREFSAADGPAAPPVAILSEVAARVLFPGIDPVGQTLRVTADPPATVRAIQIVGVARDVRAYGPRPEDVGAPTCRIFVPLAQAPQSELGQVLFVVRTMADPTVMFGAVRSAVQSVDPRAAILWLQTGSDATEALTASENTLAAAAGILATLALALACIGLYGIVSYSVVQRMGEIGIRLALGAAPSRLFRSVLTDALRPVSWGLALGLVTAAVALRVVGHNVIGLDSPQPAAIAVAALTLICAAALAAALPARRAARADPARVLRAD